jgi:type IV fimbrial biogenesis protein FimT
MDYRSTSSGFTLLELITVIGIAAILMSIAVPSYNYVTTSNRIAGEVNALLGDMQFARSEAIKEGQTVTVCPSSNGTSCLATSAWGSGWIVFSDANDDQAVDSASDIVLRIAPSFAESNSTDTFSGNGVQAVTFNREGFAAGPAGLAGTAILTLHNASNTASFTRCLEVTNTGLLATYTVGVSGCT